MEKRKIEIFTAGCSVCEDAVKKVNAASCPNCEVVIYNINKGCKTDECRKKAEEYGITRLPAIVANGQLLDCCRQDAVKTDELEAAGIGRKCC